MTFMPVYRIRIHIKEVVHSSVQVYIHIPCRATYRTLNVIQFTIAQSSEKQYDIDSYNTHNIMVALKKLYMKNKLGNV